MPKSHWHFDDSLPLALLPKDTLPHEFCFTTISSSSNFGRTWVLRVSHCASAFASCACEIWCFVRFPVSRENTTKHHNPHPTQNLNRFEANNKRNPSSTLISVSTHQDIPKLPSVPGARPVGSEGFCVFEIENAHHRHHRHHHTIIIIIITIMIIIIASFFLHQDITIMYGNERKYTKKN